MRTSLWRRRRLKSSSAASRLSFNTNNNTRFPPRRWLRFPTNPLPLYTTTHFVTYGVAVVVVLIILAHYFLESLRLRLPSPPLLSLPLYHAFFLHRRPVCGPCGIHAPAQHLLMMQVKALCDLYRPC